MAKNGYDLQKGLKENFFNWLYEQGVMTVLLFAILAGVWYSAPSIVRQIQAGYDKNAIDHKTIADTYLDAVKVQAETSTSIMDQHARETRENRRLITELLKRSDLSSTEFTEAVDAAMEEPATR
jgi:hypothetical protein